MLSFKYRLKLIQKNDRKKKVLFYGNAETILSTHENGFAKELFLRVDTVDTHRKNILVTLGVKNTVGLKS